jgi:hypothetical protein
MESPRITLARVLELGVRVSWREAVAIVHEAIAVTTASDGAGPATVTPESYLLTRGGEVIPTGTAVRARPEAIVRLLDDLLASCDDTGRFAGAVADGIALEMIEQVCQHVSAKRRRVEVASVAIRGLAAAADAARALADADDQEPLPVSGRRLDPEDEVAPVAVRGLAAAGAAHAIAGADAPQPSPVPAPRPPLPKVREPRVALSRESDLGDAAILAPALADEDLIAAVEAAREVTAPRQAVAPPSVTPASTSASASRELPDAEPQVNPARTPIELSGGAFTWVDWVQNASPASLLCLILAVTAIRILVLEIPATQQAAFERSEPAIEPPDTVVSASLDGPPLTRREPTLRTKRPDARPVRPRVVQSATRRPPVAEIKTAQYAREQESLVRSSPTPAGRRETADDYRVTATEIRSRPAAVSAAPLLVPAVANVAAAPPPAVAPQPVAAIPSASAPPLEAPRGVAATELPATASARLLRETDVRAIENVLGRYRSAFNRLDTGAAKAVWPTVNERTLARAFDGLESHDLSFERCQIEVFSGLAEAACSGRARYVPKVGNRTPRDEAHRWTFSLRKAAAGWLIDGVEAR